MPYRVFLLDNSLYALLCKACLSVIARPCQGSTRQPFPEKNYHEVRLLDFGSIFPDESDGAIITTAVAPIEIRNEYLGYDIKYHLTRLEISGNGSVEYLGRAQFIDRSTDANRKEVETNRMNTYLNSPKYFLKSFHIHYLF